MSRIKNSWMFGRFLRKMGELQDIYFDDEYHYDKMVREQQYLEEHPDSPKNKNHGNKN